LETSLLEQLLFELYTEGSNPLCIPTEGDTSAVVLWRRRSFSDTDDEPIPIRERKEEEEATADDAPFPIVRLKITRFELFQPN